MEFGSVPLDRAEGAVLAHSLATPQGRLKKGRVLSAADIDALREAGADEVVVARLGAGDVGEDEAARRIAAALVPDADAARVRVTAASTGRVNVYAIGPGVLELDAARVHAMNRVDPMLTLATLPPYAATQERTMLATVKVISYGAAAEAVDRAAEAVRDALRVRHVVMRGAGLILTDLGQGPGKGEAAMEGRLSALGMTLAETRVVPHRTEAIAEALRDLPGEMALILTASATSDAADVGPMALQRAGGRVIRFGMPVDPGNLLFVGDLAGRPVIGLPGCARAPALNGADWVLERLVCGLPVGDAEIADMGVGGLLKESPARPHPRERAGRKG
ncbi:molybdopterin-binding protein [Tranquillimonas rosea]|uniref:molybdopterin-binding protein n=1 Tax=Tranquillimonas rosea TaxID=641238 RepID=UPI003BACD40D